MYLSLDVSHVQRPVVVDAQVLGYPFRFGSRDVVVHDAQGFLMQRLVENGADPIPGMFVYPAATSTEIASDSDRLHYSRHEFETYFLQHQERSPDAASSRGRTCPRCCKVADAGDSSLPAIR